MTRLLVAAAALTVTVFTAPYWGAKIINTIYRLLFKGEQP